MDSPRGGRSPPRLPVPPQIIAEHHHDHKAFTQGILCKDEAPAAGEEKCDFVLKHDDFRAKKWSILY